MSATTWILCSKIVLISTGAISIAMAIKLTVPPVMAFAFCNVPAIWTALISWLKPPYIYFIVNGIIITIVASSRLSQLHKVVDYHENSEYKTTPPPEAVDPTHHHIVAATIPVLSMAKPEINVIEAPPRPAPMDQLSYNNEGADDDDERETDIVELKPVVVNGVIEAATMGSEAYDRVVDDQVVVSNSMWNHPEADDDGYHNHLTVSNSPQTVIISPHREAQLDYFPLLPPRFGQPKPIKVIPEGTSKFTNLFLCIFFFLLFFKWVF